MENLIDDFIICVINQITNNKPNNLPRSLVKLVSSHLDINGDIKYPKSYGGRIPNPDELSDSHQALINESKNWRLKISKITEMQYNSFIYLERKSSIKQALQVALNNCTILSKDLLKSVDNIICDPLCVECKDLTSLRVKCVKEAITNLSKIKCTRENYNIFVTSTKGSCTINENLRLEGAEILSCGCVLTHDNESSVTADELIQSRQTEMELIAQHKYGVRAGPDIKWKEYLDNLGLYAVKFEFLQIKPSCSITVNYSLSSFGPSKGVKFVLYNCARMESILRSFDEKVNQGQYPALPPFEEVDFSLLSTKEEWELVFKYILGLPFMIEAAIIKKHSDYGPHHICSFLSSMALLTSKYYRMTRILTVPRAHLLPVMYARIYLIRTLKEIITACLAIIGIKTVPQM